MRVRQTLAELHGEIGTTGIAALAIICSTAWFYMTEVSALEARRASLEQQAEHRSPVRVSPDSRLIRASSPGAQLAVFYKFFDREETLTDWLARIYTIGKGVGIEITSADYRLTAMAGRLDRYQVTVPIKGTSAQIRAFAENLLNDVPIMSLDHVNFRRKGTSEAVVEAEISLSLYLPKNEARP